MYAVAWRPDVGARDQRRSAAISCDLARKMGGDLAAEGTLGDGITVRLTLTRA